MRFQTVPNSSNSDAPNSESRPPSDAPSAVRLSVIPTTIAGVVGPVGGPVAPLDPGVDEHDGPDQPEPTLFHVRRSPQAKDEP
jgi:hypothetical protein